MGKFTALSLAGMLTVAAFGPALAADLLPPPPMVEAPVLAPAIDTSGWYLRGDVGVGVNQMSSLRSTLQPANALGGAAPIVSQAYASIGDSAIIGIGVGYQFNNWFRTDATIEYRSAAAYRKGMTYTAFCANPFCLDTYTANVSTAAFMLNGYVDLGTWWCMTPFIGAGIGGARVSIANFTDAGIANNGGGALPGLALADDAATWNFAWALHAGVAYKVTPNFTVELAYRYLDMGNGITGDLRTFDGANAIVNPTTFRGITSHDLKIGVRWDLNNPPVYQPPLIRKG